MGVMISAPALGGSQIYEGLKVTPALSKNPLLQSTLSLRIESLENPNDVAHCTGVRVSPSVVLTAAHCFLEVVTEVDPVTQDSRPLALKVDFSRMSRGFRLLVTQSHGEDSPQLGVLLSHVVPRIHPAIVKNPTRFAPHDLAAFQLLDQQGNLNTGSLSEVYTEIAVHAPSTGTRVYLAGYGDQTVDCDPNPQPTESHFLRRHTEPSLVPTRPPCLSGELRLGENEIGSISPLGTFLILGRKAKQYFLREDPNAHHHPEIGALPLPRDSGGGMFASESGNLVGIASMVLLAKLPSPQGESLSEPLEAYYVNLTSPLNLFFINYLRVSLGWDLRYVDGS